MSRQKACLAVARRFMCRWRRTCGWRRRRFNGLPGRLTASRPDIWSCWRPRCCLCEKAVQIAARLKSKARLHSKRRTANRGLRAVLAPAAERLSSAALLTGSFRVSARWNEANWRTTFIKSIEIDNKAGLKSMKTSILAFRSRLDLSRLRRSTSRSSARWWTFGSLDNLLASPL